MRKLSFLTLATISLFAGLFFISPAAVRADNALSVLGASTYYINRYANPPRSCADGANYSVTYLAADHATVDGTVDNCIAVGDQILLINLQGTSTSFANVGNNDILTVTGVYSPNQVYFTPTGKCYGDNSGCYNNIGIADGQQKVMLQRVPDYSAVTIDPTGVLTADGFDVGRTPTYESNGQTVASWSWSGLRGGVLVFKVSGNLTNNGTIIMDGEGFSGAPSRIHTESNYGQCGEGGNLPCGIKGWQGNSYAGNGISANTNNFGGGAGGIDNDASSAGGAGFNGNGGQGCGDGGCQPGGLSYGISDLSQKLYLGSGGGSGGVYGGGNANHDSGYGGNGGGIIYIIGGTITNNGTISSQGVAGGNGGWSKMSSWTGGACPGGGGSGGSIYLIGYSGSNFNISYPNVYGKPGGTAACSPGGGGAQGWLSTSITTPPCEPISPPANLRTVPAIPTDTNISLVWDPPSPLPTCNCPGLPQYWYLISLTDTTTGPIFTNQRVDLPNSSLPLPSSSLTPSHSYNCSVTAANCCGNSSAPASLSFTIPAPTPKPWLKVNQGDVHSNQ
ncbi:MAG: hypothetical protein M1609_06215 [Firmicutes bacterium]|nr:hypothetical protein [Bacillota bacterium]